MKTKRRDGWLKLGAIFISLLLIVLIAGIIEAITWVHHNFKMSGYATYQPRHLNDFYRFYRVNPAYRSETVRVNAQGFRNDQEVTKDKPKGVIRVVMMGGSTVWGDDAHYPFSGVIDNQDTIASQLESILNARAQRRQLNVRVQVLNAGVMGYMLFQNLIYFNHEIASYQPDIVIAMDGHNDLDGLKMGLKPYHHRDDIAMEQSLNQPTGPDVFRYSIKYAEEKSLFIRKAYSYLVEMANRRALAGLGQQFEKSSTEAEMEQWLNDYISTVRRFDASARIAGARALFVVQLEALGERHKLLTAEETKIQAHWSHYKWLHTIARDRLIARMQEASSKYGVWFADVTDVTKNVSTQVYLDYTHLTSHGGKIVAERLANIVDRAIFQ